MRAICLFVCLSVRLCAAADYFMYTKEDSTRGHDVSQGVTHLPLLVEEASCHVCYGDSQCWRADSIFARCEYLAETSKILPEDEVEEEDQGTGARIEVNDALSILMRKAAADERYQECIPHVSQYTDCQNGNICLGCKRCRCSQEGFWRCQQVQQCRPTVQLEIEERTLSSVIEKLSTIYSNVLGSRKKRSIRTGLRQSPYKYMNSDKLKPLRLSVGMADPTSTTQSPVMTQQHENGKHYDLLQKSGLNNLNPDVPQSASFLEKESGLQHMTDDLFKEIKKNLSVSSETTTVSKIKSDLDFNFDDLMNDNSDDSHKVNRSKLFDNKTDTKTAPSIKKYDVGDLLKMVHDIYNVKSISGIKPVSIKWQKNMGHAVVVHKNNESTTAPIPLMHVTIMPDEYTNKLLTTHISANLNSYSKFTESNTNFTLMDFHQHDYMDMNINSKEIYGKNVKDNYVLNETDATDYIDFEELNSVNVMKRDVNFVSENSQDTYNNQTIQNLNDNVLEPLNNIINEKQHEINELKKVRAKLLDYLKTYTNENFTLNKNNTQLIEESQEFAIYQLAINPKSTEENAKMSKRYNNFRRNEIDGINETMLNQTQGNKYVRKLRRDIYEILKDIIAIKKVTKTEEPHELKLLTRALKFYIRSQTKKDSKFSQDKELLNWWNTQAKTRRLYTNQPFTYVHDALIQIFQILENNILQGNALHDLSQNTRKVIKRIISDLADKDLVESDSWIGINNPNNNTTEDLATFGERVNRSLAAIKNASVFDIVDKMKMLHLILKVDKNKIQNALFVFDNNTNRRKQDQVDIHFEEDLESLKKSIDETKKYISRMFVDLDTSNYLKGFGKSRSKISAIPKKESFMRYLKKLLGKSKNGVLGIIHRAASPKDKNLELVTLNRLMEYEKIMKKWQNDLEVSPKRRKRFLRMKINNVRSELKNILPKYLTGKVGPRIIAKVKANRVNQRRYYTDRDETFNYQRDNEENDSNARNPILNKKSTETSNYADDGNTNIPNFLIMAPRKEGVRTKTAENIPYPPSDRVLDLFNRQN